MLLGPQVVLTICPVSPCTLIVSDEIFKTLLSSDSYKKYQEYFKGSFVSINGLNRNCPAPNCKNVVMHQSMKQADIICKCGNDFCFKCLKKAHRPISCHMLAEWYDKMDLEELERIKNRTRPCPNCKVPIKKYEASAHMICIQCRFEFCWLCLKSY